MCHPVISSILNSHDSGLFGITGPAGSGKTYAAETLSATHGCALYSADFRFIGDSEERRALLDRKQGRSVVDYQDSANQFNWWDWSTIYRDLNELMAGSAVVLDSPYDRKSGKKMDPIRIKPSKKILFEGAILGPPQLIDRFTRILYIHSPPKIRFDRILEKDIKRRSFNDVLARFLITEYSETIYYKNLFSWARDKLVFVDALSNHPCPMPDLPGDLFVPLRVGP
jgi:uridine kinase